MTSVTVYHNPACGTSRNALALIRNSGDEPAVIEYLVTPPDRATLKSLIAATGLTTKEVMRRKGTPFDELGLDDAKWTDLVALQAARFFNPILPKCLICKGFLARV